MCSSSIPKSEFSDCTIIICRNTIYRDDNDCRSSKVPYIERFNSLLLKFQLLKASFGAFGHLDHLLDHLLDLGGLQDQLVGKDLLGYHRRLLVGPAASSETRELVIKVELKSVARYPKHITLTTSGCLGNIDIVDTCIY